MMESLAGIHRNSKESLVLFINQTNNVSLTTDMVFFSPPVPVSETWRAGTTDKNTIIRITAREEYQDYRGSAILVYDRLDLTHLNTLIDFKIETFEPVTTHDLLTPIWMRYGIIILPEDVIDEPLVNIEENEVEPVRVVLRATSTSLKWLGQFEVTLIDGRVEFREFLTETVLPGINYPVEGDGTSGSAIVYMYSLDFTDAKDVVETYPEDYVMSETDTDFLDAVRTIDVNAGKALWNLDPVSTAWSLHGATVFYNGINDESLPTNKSFKYVMGVTLRSDVTVPPGVMYLHYNDPFDPMALEQ